MANDFDAGEVFVGITGDVSEAQAAFDELQKHAVSVSAEITRSFTTTAREIQKQLDLFATLPSKQLSLDFGGDLPGRQMLLPLEESAERLAVEFAEASDELKQMRAAAGQLALPFDGVHEVAAKVRDEWDDIAKEINHAASNIQKITAGETRASTEAAEIENHWRRISEEVETASKAGAQDAERLSRITQNIDELLADGRQVTPGIATVPAKLAETQKEIQKTSGWLATLSGKGNSASVAITQVGFAVEDFLTVIGNAGLSGGLRAAGNNFSFLASQAGPIFGLLTGVGFAVGALVAQLFEAEDEIDEVADALRDLRIEAGRASAELEHAFSRIALDRPAVEDVFDLELDRFQRQREQFKKQLGILESDTDLALKNIQITLSEVQGMTQKGVSDAFATANSLGFSDIPGRVLSARRAIQVEGRNPAFYEDDGTRVEVAKETFEKFFTAGATPRQDFIDDTQAAVAEAFKMEDIQPLLDHFEKVADEADKLSKLTGLDKQLFLPQDLSELSSELLEFTTAAIEAGEEVASLNNAINELGKNEGIRKNLVDPIIAFGQGVLDGFKQANKQLDEFNKEQEKFEKEHAARQRDAQRILEETTPLEKFKREYEELISLQKEFPGIISDDVFQQEVAMMQKEFEHLTKPETKDIKINFRGIEGVGANSAAAFARIMGAIDSQQFRPVMPRNALAEIEAERRAMPVEAPRPKPVEPIDLSGAGGVMGLLADGPLVTVLRELVTLEKSKADKIIGDLSALGLN